MLTNGGDNSLIFRCQKRMTLLKSTHMFRLFSMVLHFFIGVSVYISTTRFSTASIGYASIANSLFILMPCSRAHAFGGQLIKRFGIKSIFYIVSLRNNVREETFLYIPNVCYRTTCNIIRDLIKTNGIFDNRHCRIFHFAPILSVINFP